MIDTVEPVSLTWRDSESTKVFYYYSGNVLTTLKVTRVYGFLESDVTFSESCDIY